MTDTSRQDAWRKQNPEKAKAQLEKSTLSRKERIAQDPEYAEKIRAKAREAQAEKARKAKEGAPDGWKVVVRLAGEKRGRALMEIRYTAAGAIKGLQRKKATTDTPQTWETLQEAQEVCETLLKAFPSKIESAYPAVA